MIRPSDRGPRSGRSGKRPARTKAKAPKTTKASSGKAKRGCLRQAIAVPATGIALLAFLILRTA